jgi:hypothetical protein
MGYNSTHSLTSELDGGEWSALRPGRFTPGGRARGTHWIGGWVGPTAVLSAVNNTNNDDDDDDDEIDDDDDDDNNNNNNNNNNTA